MASVPAPRGESYAPAVAAPERPGDDIAGAVRNLATLSPLYSLFEIAATWVQLIAIIAVTLYLESPWAAVIAFVLVGARQYGLLILLHDGTHGLIDPSRRWNDLKTLWLIAAPCGSSFVNSRATHLMHHRFLGDASKDPDYFLYCSGEPTPKRRTVDLVAHFSKLIAGRQVAHTLFGAAAIREKANRSALWPKVLGLIPVALVQCLILAAFWLAGHPAAYFYLWVLPLLTLAVLFNGTRVFCEHASAEITLNGREGILVTYRSNLIERFFFAPFHMNYHAEHHFFPYVPHYNLPRLRQILESVPSYRDRIVWRPSYLRFLREYLLGIRRFSAVSTRGPTP
jgi:fatty acid desaturase